MANIAKRKAIVYVPGLTARDDEITLDAVARRLAVALDRNAQTQQASFAVSEGDTVKYGLGSFEAATITVQRTDGTTSVPTCDVYELDFRSTLKSQYEGRTPARQAWAILWLLASLLPRFLAAIPKKSKSFAEKLQIAVAAFWLAMIAAYLGLLIVTAVATAVEAGRDVPGLGEEDAPAAQASAEPADAASAPDGQAASARPAGIWASVTPYYDELLAALQSAIVILTGAGLLRKKNLKQTVTELGMEYASVIDYLAQGPQKAEIAGQFRSLIEALGEVETTGNTPEPLYDEIHVVAYSFGSIVAIDSLFAYGEPIPGPRFGLIRGLVTVGSPFDVIRMFWPDYFQQRKKPANAKDMEWLNYYSPDDVLSSNCHDGEEPTEGLDSLLPTNVVFPLRPDGQRLGMIARLRRTRFLHQEYWGASATATSFWEELAPRLFKGTPALA